MISDRGGGTLYVCGTPIGNLGDMSDRLKDTLARVDALACEDTRNTLKLLNHLNIKKKLISYHEHNKYEKAEELVSIMSGGASIALVSDAGMPAISDPGEVLVRLCHERGIAVTVVPGPCALVAALAISGMPTRRFCFEGFLPSEKEDARLRRDILEELKYETRTIVLYEAPHRLIETLEALFKYLGNRKLVLARELTKLHEEVSITTLEQAISGMREKDEKNPLKPRGEYVLILEGTPKERQTKNLTEKEILEEYNTLEAEGMSSKDAMKKLAGDTGMRKREVYDIILTAMGKKSK